MKNNRGLLYYALIGRYNADDRQEEYEAIPIAAEIVHPQYNRPTVEYDFMLLELEYPASKILTYAKLNSNFSLPVYPMNLTAVGWGVTDQGEASNSLQKVLLNYVPNEECSQVKNGGDDYGDQIKDDMLCTWTEGKDHCFGDSGGPLFMENGVQVGLVSWGMECADPIFPGVAARLSHGYEWIRQRVCSTIENSMGSLWEQYDCGILNMTSFSPVPTPAPALPTTSPAPTSYTLRIWLELFFDYWPSEISWELKYAKTQEIVQQVLADTYQFENQVAIPIDVEPSMEYQFTIQDKWGDGISGDGYYQVRMGDSLETAVTLFEGVGLFGDTKTHTFQVPARWPLPPSAVPSTMPSAMPSSSPSSSPSAKSCKGYYSSCLTMDDCCSQRCVLGKCRIPIPPQKTKLSSGYGGAAARNPRIRKTR